MLTCFPALKPLFKNRSSTSQSRTAASQHSNSNRTFQLGPVGSSYTTRRDSDTDAILGDKIRKTVKVEIDSQTSAESQETLERGNNRGW
jgi:hypothetical protein